jgi:hypothetical protein
MHTAQASTSLSCPLAQAKQSKAKQSKAKQEMRSIGEERFLPTQMCSQAVCENAESGGLVEPMSCNASICKAVEVEWRPNIASKEQERQRRK